MWSAFVQLQLALLAVGLITLALVLRPESYTVTGVAVVPTREWAALKASYYDQGRVPPCRGLPSPVMEDRVRLAFCTLEVGR